MALHVGAELLAFGEHLVEIVLSEHRAQRGLREHVGRRHEILDLDDRALGIDDVEIEHRVDLHRDVVARDHVLARNFDHLDAQIHPDHFLDERNQQHEAGALDALKAAEREDHGAFIFAQDSHRGDQQNDRHETDERKKVGFEQEHGRGLSWVRRH